MSMLAQMTDFTTIFEKILEDLGGKYQKNLYFRFQDKTINLGYLRKKNGQWSHYDLIKKESDFKMRKIGDYNYLVFDEGLYEKCKESIPEYFGIYVCNYSTWKSQSGQSLKVGKIEKMRSASKVEGFLSNLKLDWKDFSYIEISVSIAHRIEGERNENEFWPAIEKNYDKNKSLNEIKQAFYAKKAVDYTPVCKILMEHQKVGAAIAERYNKFGFFFDTGTGKTLTALEIIKKKQNESGARFMIVCPKAIINTAWMDDCEQFFPDMKLLPLLKEVNVEYYIDLYHKWKRKGLINDSFVDIYFSDLKFITLERAKEVLSRCADHYIVNPESFRISHEKFMNICGVDNEGNKKEINGLIVDESSLIRNTKSKLFQSIEYQSLKMEYVYLLSGKPAPNKTKEYLSQLRILSDELYYKCQYDIRKTSKLRYDYEKKLQR